MTAVDISAVAFRLTESTGVSLLPPVTAGWTLHASVLWYHTRYYTYCWFLLCHVFIRKGRSHCATHWHL